MQVKVQKIRYTFICKNKVQHGAQIYLSGSIKQLGSWIISKSICLSNCEVAQYWCAEVDLPIGQQIQYKYFIKNNKQNIQWIGQTNQHIKLNQYTSAIMQQQKLKKKFSLMSFNIRYGNKRDKDILHWNNRKSNCVDLIKQYFPTVIGIQQAIKQQRQYLQKMLQMKYSYFGIARDNKSDEQCGMFFRKDRIMLISVDYVWISQSREVGSKGYDAALPRYYTKAIAADIFQSNHLLIFINTHLDHVGTIARYKGIEMIGNDLMQTIKLQKQNKNQSYVSCFVIGDMNSSQNDQIFKSLSQINPIMRSMRTILSPEKVNYCQTFNGFQFYIPNIINQKRTIDHMFVSLQNLKADSFEVISKDSQEIVISDHYPILGKFHYN